MDEPRELSDELRQDLLKIEQSTDADWLLGELQKCLGVTIQHIIKVAAIVRRLDECKVEVTIEFALLPYIRRVAYGQMIPELLVSLQGDHTLLDKAACLPIPDQCSIAENRPIKVMELGGDHRKVPPLSLTRREIRQVFGRGKLRSEAEQIGWLKDEQLKKCAPVNAQPSVLLDKKRVGIVVNGNGVFISATDIAHYLAELTPRKNGRRIREQEEALVH